MKKKNIPIAAVERNNAWMNGDGLRYCVNIASIVLDAFIVSTEMREVNI